MAVRNTAMDSSNSVSTISMEDLCRCETQEQCPICLGKITGLALIDPCFHRFCFHCIQQWAEMAACHPPLDGRDYYLECPLCKAPADCIIHNIVLDTFQRDYLHCTYNNRQNNPKTVDQFPLSESLLLRWYVYRYSLSSAIARELQTRTSKTLNNKVISCSSKFIQRELQCLLKQKDVDLLSLHVAGVLEYFQKQAYNPRFLKSWRESMAENVRPFLGDDADAFCDELHNFSISGLSIEAYDALTEKIVKSHALATQGKVSNC